MDLNERLSRAADLVTQADAIIIAAGAGMGVDSGLPDFRGNEGLWKAYPALAQARLKFKAIANPESFRRNPRLAWGFYGHRLQSYRQVAPHAGFSLLHQWAQNKSGGYWIFTSNVDGQFQKAGFATSQINECHGSLHRLQCSTPCCSSIWSADSLHPDIDTSTCKWLGELPACPRCGKLLRPNVLMFEDWKCNHEPMALAEQRQDFWLERLQQQGLRPVVIELGAGTAIPSVRHFAQARCREFAALGARLIRINPSEYSVPGPEHVGIQLGALEALGAIHQRLQWK